MKKKYAIGVDYGTNSVRALIIDITDGRELASRVYNYERGDAGVILDRKDPHVARQDPSDYLKGLELSVKKALKLADRVKGFKREDVIGIGVDTTGSTPLPVNKEGTPLSFLPEFRNNINALAWLWKDHTAMEEAEEITALAAGQKRPYLEKCGGTYSSEWFFAKILHCLRIDKKVFRAAYSWVELCDYIPAVLTGNTDPLTLKRSVCAAGHKAMFNPSWGGLPEKSFLKKLAPELAGLRDRLYDEAFPAGVKMGKLAPKWAGIFGLSTEVTVSVGAFDAHMGAVGSGIKPGTLVKIIGTSTCDTLVFPGNKKLENIKGICGIVKGSILPGYYGLEAGQSAVGDIFNWFVNFMGSRELHEVYTGEAEKLKPGESGLMALDWNNGNRTVLVDPKLTGLLTGQTLYTKPHEVYRALLEATAFGARVIIDRFEEYGVKVSEIVNCGGIAEKNPLFMQIYADIFNRPMKISRSAQTCALGAALFGAVAAGSVNGGYDRVEDAQKRITGIKNRVFRPKKENVLVYAELFKIYKKLHDGFGTGEPVKMNTVMKELLKVKARVK